MMMSITFCSFFLDCTARSRSFAKFPLDMYSSVLSVIVLSIFFCVRIFLDFFFLRH